MPKENHAKASQQLWVDFTSAITKKKALRLQQAQAPQNRTVKDWENVAWSDES